MLSRCLAAGPSRAILRRQFASAAVAETAEAPSYPPAHATRVNSAKFTSRPEQLQRLIASANEAPSPQMRKSVWNLYSTLAPFQRSALSVDELRLILQAMTPRHDDAWRVAQTGSPRSRKHINDTYAAKWEKKLRAVMSELVSRQADKRVDWLLVLQSLHKVGAVSAVEAVWKSLPADFQRDREFNELRLGTIVRYARNVRASQKLPKPDELNAAYTAFWDTFRALQGSDVKIVPITHRLLIVASSELSALMHRVGNEDAFTSFNEVLRYVLAHGYGLDMDNIPLSLERRAQELAAEGKNRYPALSPAALNAVLDHMSRSGVSAHRLFAIFDTLTVEAREPSVSARSFDDEDEDEFIPTLSSMTAAENASGERRDWLGRRVNAPPADEDPVVEQTIDVSESAAEEKEMERAPAADQGRRSLRDYLPPTPSPRDVQPATTEALPKRMPYNAETVLILLRAARTQGKLGLVQRILEVAVADAQERNAKWLAAYLSCPDERRVELVRPLRISPEWFHTALAAYSDRYDRYAGRTVHVLRDVLAWIQDQIDVVVATETKRLSRTPPVVDDRIVLPKPPYFANLSPRDIRFLRNRDVFVSSEEVARLHRDQALFVIHHNRALNLARRRATRYATAHDSRAACQGEIRIHANGS